MTSKTQNTPGRVVGFKVEGHRPEDEPRAVAIRLANALQAESNARADVASFREQAHSERRKAKEMDATLIRLAEYNRKKAADIAAGVVRKVSRMEPMETYDAAMIKDERAMLIARGQNFTELADEAERRAKAARAEGEALQRQLREG